MLKELGYSGIGYTGTQQIPEMLKALDAQGLKMFSINGADGGDTNRMPWNRLIQTLDRGSCDVGRVLRILKQLGYMGPIGLQCYAIRGDSRENLKHSMEGWRQLRVRSCSTALVMAGYSGSNFSRFGASPNGTRTPDGRRDRDCSPST
ncbi:MAG: hypothetical protein ACOX1P_05225 [Thermoguttaceae bacterium]